MTWELEGGGGASSQHPPEGSAKGRVVRSGGHMPHRHSITQEGGRNINPVQPGRGQPWPPEGIFPGQRMTGTKDVHQRESGQEVLQWPADLGPVVGGRVQGILDAVEVPHHHRQGLGLRDEQGGHFTKNAGPCPPVLGVGIRRSMNMQEGALAHRDTLQVARHQVRYHNLEARLHQSHQLTKLPGGIQGRLMSNVAQGRSPGPQVSIPN
jgi:hypothetical protein